MSLFRKRREEGAALVEAAFIVPLVILLLMGVVDFARAFLAEITLNNAVSEGALYAAQFPAPKDDIKDRVVEAGDDLTLAVGDITITCDTTVDPNEIEVEATSVVDMLTFVGQWFGPSITLVAQSTAINTQSTMCDADVIIS